MRQTTEPDPGSKAETENSPPAATNLHAADFQTANPIRPPTASVSGVPLSARSAGAGRAETARPGMEDFQVLIPAFVTSQLKEAFEIGFLIFIPFIIIDMVIANVLLAMGMIMLSPSVISLPFKLLLFVLVDGWFLIVKGLVLSYT
jgi:hypothetical protein